jgi:hypothetical protein
LSACSTDSSLNVVHTWEVPPELHASAVASANRRYRGHWQEVDDLLAGKRGEAEARRQQDADARAS